MVEDFGVAWERWSYYSSKIPWGKASLYIIVLKKNIRDTHGNGDEPCVTLSKNMCFKVPN